MFLEGLEINADVAIRTGSLSIPDITDLKWPFNQNYHNFFPLALETY